MSPRVPAESEIRRILAMVPWILAHPGCTRAEIGARFGISESRVVADLRRILLIGAPPFGGGDYIDVIDDDDDGGGVTIHLGDAFRRPLRLHPAEALHVLVAGRALLGVPGAEADGPLASALTKIERAIGATAPEVEIAATDSLEPVQAAAEAGERIEIDYVAADGETTSRRIDPRRVFYRDGQWYVAAYCFRARDDRMFRIDRIRAVRGTGERVEPGEIPDVDAPFRPDPSMPRVTIRIPPAGRWLIEAVPVDSVDDGPDGTLDVVVAVADRAWFEGLLLRLGPGTRVLGPDDWADTATTVAARVLARYRVG